MFLCSLKERDSRWYVPRDNKQLMTLNTWLISLITSSQFDFSLVSLPTNDRELRQLGVFHSDDGLFSPVHHDVGDSVAVWKKKKAEN